MQNTTVSSENQVADQVSIRENKLTLVERFADDLAHEIKNPLHSMVINLEVLRRRIARLETGSHDELLRYAAVLNAELERVNRRVDLLLRMVRPNRDSDEPATFAEIVEELRELVELECERHRVTFELRLSGLTFRSRLPKASTRQMLLSLILKTLDSVPGGGVLRLSTEESHDALRISLEGFDPEGVTSVSPDSAHNGSYLAVARTLAVRLGGDLEIVTVSDSGTNGSPEGACRFVLTLPTPG
jgi:signal transduction histidine kinase